MPSSQKEKALHGAATKRADKFCGKGKGGRFQRAHEDRARWGHNGHQDCLQQALDALARAQEPLRGAADRVLLI